MIQIFKSDFITAYCYAYGATKKAALQAWKISNDSYKREIIAGYKEECKKRFYND